MSSNGFWIQMARTVTLFLKIKERCAVGKVLLVVVLAALLTASSVTPDLAAQDPENGLEPKNLRPEPPQQKVVEIETQDIGLQEVVGQSMTLFKRYPAQTFVPAGSDTTYEYYSAGCVRHLGGDQRYFHDLQLPEGAVIDYLRLYFYDNDPANNAVAYLYAYDGYGNVTAIATVASSGTPGQSTALSDYFSHTVDNTNEALAIMLYYEGATTAQLRMCGVRIRYQYSFPTLYLPLLMKELTNQ